MVVNFNRRTMADEKRNHPQYFQQGSDNPTFSRPGAKSMYPDKSNPDPQPQPMNYPQQYPPNPQYPPPPIPAWTWGGTLPPATILWPALSTAAKYKRGCHWRSTCTRDPAAATVHLLHWSHRFLLFRDLVLRRLDIWRDCFHPCT